MLCPLVNPLCPDDLCILEAGHKGTEQGKHTLGTDCYDQMYKYVSPSKVMYLSEMATTKEELIQEGYERSVELGFQRWRGDW